MMYGYFFVSQILLGLGFAFPFVAIAYGDLLNNTEKVTDIATLFAVFGGFIVLFFYYFWYKPEYKWKLRKSPLSWKLTAPIVIYWVLLFGVMYTVAAGHLICGIPSFSHAIPMIAAGICEEVAFREVGISFMRRQLKGEKMILPTIVITSAAFGVTHLMNCIQSGNVLGAAEQSALATTLGIFFGAVFIRTGDIRPYIAAHGLHDLLIAVFSVNMGSADFPAYVTATAVICEVALMIWGFYLVRKEKRPEIEALWAQKWQTAESAEAESSTAA
ncbi:MAG: CPBP family intramembrane metalloprotease [Oscillospiraceae bacterium]|nr:CPBP family intramembrane metalloprotease [Oscillospiraceae bacterium]